MPLDFGLIKSQPMPSYLDSAHKASTLASLAQNQARMGQQMSREEEEAKRTAHLQKASEFGNALNSLSGLSEPVRAQEYGKVRADLVSRGVVSPDQMPEQYDPGYYGPTLNRWLKSEEGVNAQLKQAQVGNMKAQTEKLRAEARQGPAMDPYARQLGVMEAKDQLAQKQKQREIQQYSQVGGWKLNEGATPTADDAKKFKAGASAARALLDNLNEYQSLVRENGTEIGGKTAQRMETLLRDIQLSAKNEDLYGLGVLTGPDLQLLEEVVGSAPTGLGAKLNPMAWGGAKALNKSQQFRDSVNARMNAKAKTYGFEPDAEWRALASGQRGQAAPGIGAGEAVASDAPKAPAGRILMQAPNGAMKYVSEAEKGEAIAAGGKVVK